MKRICNYGDCYPGLRLKRPVFGDEIVIVDFLPNDRNVEVVIARIDGGEFDGKTLPFHPMYITGLLVGIGPVYDQREVN